MKLSIIIPVFNEKNTILEVIAAAKGTDYDKEIIVVDDCSTDGTREILKDLRLEGVKLLYHDKNRGKGAAIKTALKETSGDVVIIQDADLEYSVDDYPQLLKPIISNKADVVFGSRFIGGPRRVMYFWHQLGNFFVNFLVDILYDTTLTDLETGYKVFKKGILEELNIQSEGFDFEVEVTVKILKKKYRFFESPISYAGRTYAEGKKITWQEGLRAIFILLKYKFFG